jgi:ribosomal protein S18 acetylase RimI-like enzyme
MTDASHTEITTAIGFEEKDRESLADIIWSAFHAKADWIYKNDVQKEKEVMRALPVPESTIVARIGDRVVGFLIFKTSQTNQANKPLEEVMRRHRNWRTAFLLLLAHRPERDELYIFLIAASAGARGAGVGTALLRRACDIARERGLARATLHVIEENPRAKRLYDREGFVDAERIRLPWFLPRRVFSFKAAWFQRKALA